MEITPDKWQRAKAVFDAVLQRPSSERESFLASVRAESDLRDQVEQLLRDHEQAGSFLSKPVIELPKPERFAPGSIVAGHWNVFGGRQELRVLGQIFDTELGRFVALEVSPILSFVQPPNIVT